MNAVRIATVAIVVATAALALGWRARRLADRPMHCDEAVHALKLGELLQRGTFTYDPTEYHGPTLHDCTLPVLALRGARSLADVREQDLRIVPLLFSIGSILLLLLVADALGPRATVAAALLSAISPILAYYSRYYIQESLLSFSLLLTVVAAYRYTRKPSAAWAALAGGALGFAFATKETCILHWAALALAAIPALHWPSLRKTRLSHMFLVPLVALAVAAVILTSLFRNPEALADSIRTFLFYSDRATGQGHEKGVLHFFQLLLGPYPTSRTGPELLPLSLALVGAIATLFTPRGRRSRFALWIALYLPVIFLIHSIIPYKTPWLMLPVVQLAIPLAGVGVAAILDATARVTRQRALALIPLALLLLAGLHQARQCAALCLRYAADDRNPYAYSHTSTNLLDLLRNIREAASLSPHGRDTSIQVISPEYWPIPWYLRDFPNVGYWNELPPASEPIRGPIVVTSIELEDRVKARLDGLYVSDWAGLRPGFLLSALIRKDLWDPMVAARSSPRH